MKYGKNIKAKVCRGLKMQTIKNSWTIRNATRDAIELQHCDREGYIVIDLLSFEERGLSVKLMPNIGNEAVAECSASDVDLAQE